MKRSLLAAVLLSLAGPGAWAVPLRFQAQPAEEAASSREVTLRLVPQGTAEARTARLQVPGETVVDLPAGLVWQVLVESPELWASPQWVAPADGPGEQLVPLRMFPAATLTGLLEPVRGVSVPSLLDLRLEASPGGKAPRPPATPLQCPVAERRFRCPIPAGRLDLRLRAGKSIPAYLWDVEIRPGEVKDLGALPVKPGASVVGWVQDQDQKGIGGARVRLEPLVAGLPDTQSKIAGLRAMALEGRSNERGFFQIEEPAPGMYLMAARKEAFATARRSGIEIRPDLETNLSEPLQLSSPLRFRVSLEPSLDPQGNPWKVQLSETPVSENLPGAVSFAGHAGVDGVWEQGGLSAGSYDVSVADEERQWAIETIELEPGQTTLHLSLRGLWVLGRITVGDEPLEATLWLGGRFGPRRVRFQSDPQGRFEGLLPGEGLWDVDLESPREGLRLRLEPVKVERIAGQDRTRIEIRVPDTRLSGIVVDEKGEPVPEASILLLPSRKRTSHAKSDAEGRFVLRGLPPGPVIVHSEQGDRESDWMEARLSEDAETADLRLVLRSKLAIQGRVFSGEGLVAGAQILARTELNEIGAGSAADAISGPAGEFTIKLPAGTRLLHLTVLALGYPVRMMAIPLGEEPMVEVPLESAGGTLVFDLGRRTLTEVLETRAGVLAHGGTFVPFQQAARWARLLQMPQRDPSRLEIPVEPGQYVLCFGAEAQTSLMRGMASPSPQCSQGSLAPLGELVLPVPEKMPAAESLTGATEGSAATTER